MQQTARGGEATWPGKLFSMCPNGTFKETGPPDWAAEPPALHILEPPSPAARAERFSGCSREKGHGCSKGGGRPGNHQAHPCLAHSGEATISLSFLQVCYLFCRPFVASSSGSPIAQALWAPVRPYVALSPSLGLGPRTDCPPPASGPSQGPSLSANRTGAGAEKSRQLGHHSPLI